MRKRLLVFIIAFCISFVSMVGLSLFSMERFTRFTAYSDQVDHTNSVIKSIMRTEMNLKDIDRAERGYMITRDTMYLRFLNNSTDSLYTMIGYLSTLTQDHPGQQNNIALIKSSISLRIAAVRSNMMYIDTAHASAPSKYYYESRQLMLECSHRLNSLLKNEKITLETRFKGQQFYQQLTTNALKYLLVIFCIVTLVLFAIMIRELRGRIRFQQQLQAKVIDLKRSHAELQEIAYAASHDLQEPLRKIQVFSNMFLYKQGSAMADTDKATFSRIIDSASRMQVLITDLISLTSLTKIDQPKALTDLNTLLQFILIDLEDIIKEKQATINVQGLPIINGYSGQLKILFNALLDNSLKFTPAHRHPVITITYEITNGAELKAINPNLSHKKFNCITCTDNGIGFDDQYITKMFQLFQRLHTQESGYSGKGIGLAISQRIMANHEGYILAHGDPQAGAKFKLFFPVDD
jgi:signal transduction histidine kinase